MMGSRNARGLSIGIPSSKQARKYLGDSNDPHFIPKSPLIERQKFSAHDEEELKRMCALALTNVPHSDDMTDDPFRYLASAITVKQQKQPPPRSEQRADTSGRSSEQNSFPAELVSSGTDTATPSDTSKRETIRTNNTTPLTTPEVTPGETGKRFSDAGKRPVTALPSSLRTEMKAFKGNAVYSFLKDPVPSARPQTAASKSLTHLPSLKRFKTKEKATDASKQTTVDLMSQPNFNKSLPAIPRVFQKEPVDQQQHEEKKPRGITRMLKTVRLQRTQTAPTVQIRSQSNELPRQQHVLDKTAAAMTTTKKPKFTISSLFHKRSTNNPKRATVG